MMHPLDRLHTSLAYAKAKHPAFVRSHWHALGVLLEEVAEVAWALIRRDWANLHEELGHVGAVIIRWIEYINENAPGSHVTLHAGNDKGEG